MLHVDEVLYVPGLRKNILSVATLEDCEFSRSYQLPSWSVFDQAKALSFLLSSF
jgi:hypothetical protein